MVRALLIIIIVSALFCSCARQQNPVGSKPVQAQTVVSETGFDETLQKVATDALGQREGAVLVIDPQNGRLRAVVNDRITFEQTYPPGSAIKPFTALTAMRTGILDRESKHQCRTRYARGGFEIVCSHPKSTTPFNLTQALAYSCNDYFANIGERLSEGAFNSTLGSFGFGERTGVNATESKGSLPQGEWHVQTALGDSDRLLVTPIQMITAYMALLNGGHLYRPQRSNDPNLIPQESARLNIAEEHRAILIEGMRGAVKYGTAAKASLSVLPGYVFGKTGTSTSSNGFRTQGWFVGFVADKSPVGVPKPEQIKLGVLVFLRRAHGSQCAEIARPILECGMRAGNCQSEKAREKPPSTETGTKAQSSDLKFVKVRSIRDNLTYELPLEDYLLGVVSSEASTETEFEALKAQAVVSRSYALTNLGRHASEGYDFCSLTHCQQYLAPKDGLRREFRRAVDETAGEILSDSSGKPVEVYFHAACGGVTANIEKLWGAPSPAPEHLRGVRDDFCAAMPNRRWNQAIAADQLLKALKSDERTDVGSKLSAIIVSKRDETGRAELLSLEGERRRSVRGWDFKIIVGRALGWQMIKSSRFEVTRVGNEFVFRGSGFGHGLGLCQSGAHVMAKRGMAYRQILNHYFPTAQMYRRLYSLRLSPLDENVQETLSRATFFPTPTKFAPAQDCAVHAANAMEHNFSKRVTNDETNGPRIPRRLRINADFYQGQSAIIRGIRVIRGPFRSKKKDLHLNVGRMDFIVSGTNRQTLSSEHFRISFPRDVEPQLIDKSLRLLENMRSDLISRIAKAGLQIPETQLFEVVIHSSTSEFIRATGQSGWAAGATESRKIQLQPMKILQKRGILMTTLRHELAHAFIEILGGGRAPRWLAEGLSIGIAGEGRTVSGFRIKNKLGIEELERRLRKRAPASEMRELYAMAYREVRLLIQTEGEMRVWRRVAGFGANRISRR